MARKGKVRWVMPDPCDNVDAAIEDTGFTPAEARALRKDLRLVAAALASSRMMSPSTQRPRDCFDSLL